MAWIVAILTYHSSFLVAAPSPGQWLAYLTTVISSRASVHKKLLKLSGRLDLVLSQVCYKIIFTNQVGCTRAS